MRRMKAKKADDQSARFIEAAKAIGPDESAKPFEVAPKNIVRKTKHWTVKATPYGKWRLTLIA
jgi:hypothetical protein